ncbi:polyribonucleotide nucleotidyltransferase [Candidatus Jorgensenbacteria bacterium CG23_combo_of_CG06-09_8_20_14_all_54_14]|uniref:Polyribonucleotide nucleotidyltransferase n=2 Tax=Candidatus Joergenseniibacteriota TaxID=1752739 RepID=A0A2G9ZAH8_9BACT|nr:MAG: polyribonucleotide nucleotidyltransferase [Candidatus Jorgensenbacteria bacterium CG23_combo_of_CG06-09_8_20_14_all_54_14]
MELNRKIFKSTLGGESISVEVSELAHQANGAVMGRHGDTVVLAAVVMGEKETTTDYFPLTVDYEERFYAAGKILGSRFIRREGRASDNAVLSGRLIDRTIRPLFDQRLRREVQVTVTVIAYDEKHDPDAVALLATSTALAISDIPWNGPVAGVSLNATNPDGSLRYQSFFAGPEGLVNMIEFEGVEVPEVEVQELFARAQKEIAALVAFQCDVAKKIGKPKTVIAIAEPAPEVRTIVERFIKDKLADAIHAKSLGALKHMLMEHLTGTEAGEEAFAAADALFEDAVDSHVRKAVLEREERPDGRKLNEVRDLHAEVGLLPRTHGSALFIRGDTQILAVVTLASPAAEQIVETMEATERRRFMLHYNFPSFSVGETGRARGPGRREIGHGALAAKAVRNLIPSKETFPYTIRVVAETLSSNGSSSMASACAASLALMDAGVPLKTPVAGIAMGLMAGEDGSFKVLTDIQGPEDNHGDMDLKIAGTRNGITAAQMDVKLNGITAEIFAKALEDAKRARLHILETIERTLPAPRPKISPYAPTIKTLIIPVDKIGAVIGPGGRTINGIINTCGGGVDIDVEEDGKVFVSGTDAAATERAFAMVQAVVREYEIGDIVEGPVIKIMDFGAIVDLGGGRDGMIHVSELKEGFVQKVEDVVRLGDRVRAKVIRADTDGRIGLSLRNVPQ